MSLAAAWTSASPVLAMKSGTAYRGRAPGSPEMLRITSDCCWDWGAGAAGAAGLARSAAPAASVRIANEISRFVRMFTVCTRI